MKNMVIASLVVGSLGVEPVLSATMGQLSPVGTRSGTFAGARLRIPFGHSATAKPRLAVTLAPMLRSEAENGRVARRFGEGLAFGFAGGERSAKLSFGGRPLSAFSSRDEKIDPKKKAGISTLGYVAIGAAVVLIGGGLLFADALNDASE